ncbi:WecB/TagA/CpsF family glycosyltransferase [Bacteroides acidifaciens]|uniref:WecB/TagA/CpsF family glycosyltransferase n=1 Tax=Bacteroides acidifaciens TaxID=85831 RepID=UPI000F47AD42|nr:WecB/TagA/CpsF family glycosyltransferase [Bacteroides acidifaciens]ROT17582.1 glycosyltransferase [Muribaculaceae bacterium Isolate-110 (HZI)]
MKTFFNIRYELDRQQVHKHIARRLEEDGSDYICVADGVIMNTANRSDKYLDVVNGGMFSICDSSYVPLYIRWIYGQKYEQYCGSEIFMDIVSSRKYRMIFLGTQQHILDGLKKNLTTVNPDVENMAFVELPFHTVSQFDYPEIAGMIEDDGADIVWVALGAPKQEIFMSMLKPHLKHGVMIAVGAAFKFYSGVDTSRAPGWMVRNHLEFVHRLTKEPKKQIRRCFHIVRTLPVLLYKEWKYSREKGKLTVI